MSCPSSCRILRTAPGGHSRAQRQAHTLGQDIPRVVGYLLRNSDIGRTADQVARLRPGVLNELVNVLAT